MSPELINNIATLAGVIVAGLGAFIFAFWVAMGIWTFNDIRSRTRDWLAISLAVLLVLVFPLVGLILYTMIRPKATLADTYDRALEEEALLRELEATQACMTCGVPVQPNWIYCPTCHSQLQHTCPSCSNVVRNEWAICVFCGAPQRAAQGRELGARELQPAYNPASSARPTLEAQAAPALAAGLTAGSGAGNAPAPVQRRPMRNPFAAPAAPAAGAGAVSPAGSTAASSAGANALPPAGPPGSYAAPAAGDYAPIAPLAPSDYSDYPDYDDSPYRPARAGEG